MPSQAVTGATAFKLTLGAQAAAAVAVLGAVGLFVLSPDAERDAVQVEPLDSRVAAVAATLTGNAGSGDEPTYEIDPGMVSGMYQQIANAPEPPEPDDESEDDEPVDPVVATGPENEDISKLFAYLGMVSMTGADGTDRRLALIKLNDAGSQRMVPAGTDLGDGRVLAEITSEAVIFETDGTRTELTLAERSAPAVSTSTASSSVNAATSSIPGANNDALRNPDQGISDRVQRAEDSRRRALERARELRERSGDNQSSAAPSTTRPVSPQSRLGANARGDVVIEPGNQALRDRNRARVAAQESADGGSV